MIRLKDLITERKSLYVFDFDDTLARSEAYIYVTKADGTELKLDPAEYAVYEEEPGVEFDFREFSNMLRNPQAIRKNLMALKRAMSNPQNKVTVLTARAVAYPLRHFFKTQHGIDPYVVGVASSDPMRKADWIERHIQKGYDYVYFTDDSPKNIKAVAQLQQRYPNAKIDVELAK